MSIQSLDEKTKEVKESTENLYKKLKQIDYNGQFKLESTQNSFSVSIERYDWKTPRGKYSHRYCIRENGKPILRTREFDIAFWNYLMRLI